MIRMADMSRKMS